MKEKEMLEREKVREIQEGKNIQKHLMSFWNMYKRMAYKNSITVLKFYKKSPLDMEDYMQEAFIMLLEACNAVDLSKIRDDNWRLLKMYWFSLKKLNIKYIRKFRKENKNVTAEGFVDTIVDDENDSVSYIVNPSSIAYCRFLNMYNPEIDFFNNSQNEILHKERIFLNSISPFQKKILAMRQKEIPVKDIASELNTSTAKVYRHVRELKTIASSVFGTKYQYN